MKTQISQKMLVCLVCLLVVAIPGISNAALNGPVPGNNSIVVNFSDLDLNNLEGVKSLYQRLKAGVHKVCGPKTGVETISVTIQRNQCFDATLSNTVNKINNQLLQQLHTQGETG